MEIKGTSGAKEQVYTIDLVLVDPCHTVDLGLQTSPFSDESYVFVEPAMAQEWQATQLIQPATLVDCGAISVEFYNADLSAIDTVIFEDDRSAAPTN